MSPCSAWAPTRFLTLTLWIAMFERDHDEPLAMQLDYAAQLAHMTLPYPDITT